MSGRIFWAAGVLLLAVIVHLGYVLFGPRAVMGGFEAQAAGLAGGVNRMHILAAEQYADLFGEAAPGAAGAVCAYDLSAGDVMLHAAFASTPWTLTLYSARGNAIYALNDAQAGAQSITVRIRPVSGLKRLLGGDEEAGIVNDGWRAESAETRGLAVLWTPLADPALRPRNEENLRQSYCRTAG